jgi:ribosomal protein S17
MTAPLNHSLISEVIFTNDEAFSQIASTKARMMLCVCKDAKNNKNIQISFENEKKINKYSRFLKSITEKKAKSLYQYVVQDDLRIPVSSYRKKVIKIKTELLKENAAVIEGVKKDLIIQQLQLIIDYYKKIDKMMEIVSNLGIDVDYIDDITKIDGDDGDICESDPEYEMVNLDSHFIGTLFKYNAYCMNMLFNDKMTEEATLQYVCSDDYDNNWMIKYQKTHLIFEVPVAPTAPA